MSQVDVQINGKSYNVSCDDGQEDHLLELAGYVDQRVQELIKSVGQVGDARILVMACLLIADELAETYSNEKNVNSGEENNERVFEQRLVQVTNELANRIERIADTLGST